MKKLARFAIALGGLSLLFGTTTSSAGPAYDGRWSVRVVVVAGDCSLDRPLPIRVADGRVSLAALFGPRVRGKVRRDGQISIRLSHAGEIVDAAGVLAGQRGNGSWKSPTLDCGGVWKATKS